MSRPLKLKVINRMSEQQQLVKREPAAVEYQPFGSQDKVKLTVAIIQNLIAVKTKSGKTCSDRDAIRFMAMCQAKRINPFEGDCFLIGYDGREGPQFALVTAHQTYLKRAELHPEFDGMKSGVIVHEEDDSGKITTKDLEGDYHEENQQVTGGWATVYFKTRKQPMHKRLNLSRFNKGYGQWSDNPAGMICKCAEADALRSAFPTMLGGLYLREEIELEPAKPQFAKPLFNGGHGPAVIEAPPAEAETKPAPDETPEPERETKPAEPATPEQGGFNALKAVRGLCREAKIREGKLIEALTTDGTIPDGFGSLDELALSNGGMVILKAISDNWKSVAEKMGGVK